jgi:nucleoside 2-deoxyribosyltransferase
MKCFVIMPFAQDFDDVYSTIGQAVSSSVPGEHITCLRLDEIKSAGRITDDLLRELHEATVCIADLTYNKPNVMWEIGYAMALNKPLLLITQTPDELSFDIKDMRTISYNRQSLRTTLQIPLGQAFRDTLGTYAVPRESTQFKPLKSFGKTIAVTGSRDGDKVNCAGRIESLLEPHLSEKVTWLCGSFGMVDELAAEFLISHKQQVVVVGYHSYDMSEHMFDIISLNQIPFVDSSKEQSLRGIQAPTDRDLYFLTRASLVILCWNGRSVGTRELIEWYYKQQKDHVVGFFTQI